MNKKSAFPDPMRGVEQSFSNQDPNKLDTGISKRLYIATKIVIGIMNKEELVNGNFVASEIAKKSFKIADELIKQDES